MSSTGTASQSGHLMMDNTERAPAGERNSGSLAAPPAIALPKGGGAIRGIGEKFSVNPVTGTGSLTVPLAVSPGRSDFGPQLHLSYDSGAGNGPFGLGWSLGLPQITRKSDKGLPRYNDAVDSDTFILSGAEDLVPEFKRDAEDGLVLDDQQRPVIHEISRTVGGVSYRIRRYRPRIEGLFARIERWTNEDSDEVHWRSISRDNITTHYGSDPRSRIADPVDANRVFTWLICASHDDKGNAILYEYAEENASGADPLFAHEGHRHREPKVCSANRYLKRIHYGNARSLLIPQPPLTEPDAQDAGNAGSPAAPPTLPNLSGMKWHFEVVFDYGEGHYENLPPDAQEQQFVSARVKAPAQVCPRRADPFSSYRAGFEVRTYRLCRRVLMFHHFPVELGVEDYLVRCTELVYEEGPVASFITSVSQSGFVRHANETYLKKSLPPLDLGYTLSPLQDRPGQPFRDDFEVQEVDAVSLENLPSGIDGVSYQLADLDGEGISGILIGLAEGWHYKPNLGDGKFGPLQTLATRPSLAALESGGPQLLDLAGDGKLDLADLDGSTPGFYERTEAGGWQPFRTFRSLPNLAWQDPNLRFVDLTGDGHADILITENDALTWHPSLAEEGFDAGLRVSIPGGEENGPRVVFAGVTQSIFLADFTGDGLTDIVRVRNGDVCYWPNLGYGRFGAKVTMDNAPRFDHPEQFDPRRLRLADTDGSGVTDLVYLGHDAVRIFLNESGNGWSTARTLRNFPASHSSASIQVADLLGAGTACLVWSSPLPGDSRRSLRYLDLMKGKKPHLLVRAANNLGSETHIDYASSTKFYLADKVAGTPWITRLPFPVHVVERVVTWDRISNSRFVTRTSYHHGFYDGVEREFQGFGMVEQWDTEEPDIVSTDGEPRQDADNTSPAFHVPPVHTKTWCHTGAYIEGGKITGLFEQEYYREGGGRAHPADLSGGTFHTSSLPDTEPPADLSAGEEREACRALKGSILRVETYAKDGTEQEGRPYTVSERNYTVVTVQPRGRNPHAVFFTHPREILDLHYERQLYKAEEAMVADPRVTHALTLKVDKYGNTLQAAMIGYGRLCDAQDDALQPQERQTQRLIHITHTENRVTNAIDDSGEFPDAYRAPLPAESRTYEVRKSRQDETSQDTTIPFRLLDILAHVQQAGDGHHDVPYEDRHFTSAGQMATEHPEEQQKYFRRLIDHVRTLYRKDAPSDPVNDLLALYRMEALALSGETYKLAFTPGLLAQTYTRSTSGSPSESLLLDPVPLLRDEGRYILSDEHKNAGLFPASDPANHWWIPSGRALEFARDHFFLPKRYRDPFGSDTRVDYDAYHLFPRAVTDSLGNRVSSAHDYRVLQPFLVTDPNGNRSATVSDALGLVVGTAIMGPGDDEEDQGDLIDSAFMPDLDEDTCLTHLANPLARPHALLQKATSRLVYDLFAYWRSRNSPHPQPVVVHTLVRETHHFDLEGQEQTRIQQSFSYSDGFGRVIQQKIQAEPGPIPLRDAEGNIMVRPDGRPEMTSHEASPRWVGTGWTVFNNKGNPVRQFEPFFSDTHRFDFDVRIGVSTVLFYDPLERVIATLRPDHTYDKIVFDPWQQTTWDVNDTVLLDPRTDADINAFTKGYFENLTDPDWKTWHMQRISGLMGAHEQAAAQKTAAHANTPTTTHLDTLGRSFLTVTDNGPDPARPGHHLRFATRVELDIEGNQRSVVDARGRIVMRYDYDMLGAQVYQSSMEAGKRWGLHNVAGRPMRVWDSRRFIRRITYDALQRPVGLLVLDGTGERLAERIVYGESQPREKNLRTRVHQTFDDAGVVTNEAYDFKGNLLKSTRQLRREYRHEVNWNLEPERDPQIFSSSATYDALNRSITATTPDGSVIRHAYNEANLLERVEVRLRAEESPTTFVDNVRYDVKGRREKIEYGSGARTEYTYDRETFRLTRLRTTRRPGLNGLGDPLFTDSTVIQDLLYTHDPAGNITHMDDASLRTVSHGSQAAAPASDYTYDALYRLTKATGREHIGQASFDFNSPGAHRDYCFSGPQAHPNDLQALRRYVEHYEYDAVGNFREWQHVASGGSWTRTFDYEEPSLIEETTQRSNRLTRTKLGNGIDRIENYTHDAHGNMTSMPHLASVVWDFEDQMSQVDLAGGGRAFYLYDATGQRVRKVIEQQNGARKKERIYLGGFELYREYEGDGQTVALERESLHVMDDQQRIALVETKTKDCTQPPSSMIRPLIRYQISNHLGSASLELDAQAHLISYEEYHPYGTTSFQARNTAAEVSLKRYRYTGKERDEESGLYYHGARYYAPWLGRWMSCDPAGLTDGVNVYRYVGNNPVRLVDPSGTFGLDTLNTVMSKANRFIGIINPGVGAGQALASSVVEKISEAASGKAAPQGGEPARTLSPQERAEAVNDLLMSTTPAAPIHHMAKAVGKAITGKRSTEKALVDVAKAEPTGLVSKVFETAEDLDRAESAANRGADGDAAEAYVDAGLSFMELVAAGTSLAMGARSGPGKGTGGKAAPKPNSGRSPGPGPKVKSGVKAGASSGSSGGTPNPGAAPPSAQKPDVPVGALRRWIITPGASYRGVTDAIRRQVKKWAGRYGTMDGPPTTGSVHAGHQYGGSHVFTPEGQTTQVGAQTAYGNLSQASAEARAAEFRRRYNEANPDKAQLPVRPKGSR